jgi:hypothetical protein
MECKTERNSYLVLFLKYIVVVRKGELVKFIDLLTKDGETSVVVDYCITIYNTLCCSLEKGSGGGEGPDLD